MAKKRKKRAKGEGACFYSESKAVWVGRARIGTAPGGKPICREVTARTQADCLARMRQAVEEARTAAPITGPDQKVADFLQHWLDNAASATLSPRVLHDYRGTVRLHIVPVIGNLPLRSLAPAEVELIFGRMLRAGQSPGSVRKARTVLSAAIGHALLQGHIAVSPLDRVPVVRLDEKEINPLTTDEVRAVLAVAPTVRRGLLAVLALATGARRGELLALGWEHINLQGELRIERSLYFLDGAHHLKPPKTKTGRRTVPLPEFALAALRSARQVAEASNRLSCPVLCDEDTGDWLTRDQAVHAWRSILKKAKVPPRRFHDARHTHASELLRRSVPLPEVARRLGDRPETVLRVYAHYLPSPEGVPALLDTIYGAVGGDTVENRITGGAEDDRRHRKP